MRMVIFFLVLLSGCATLQKPETLRACAGADVATTVIGVSTGRMVEANPLWKASVNAGRYVPFILATVIGVMLIEWLNEPKVTATASGVLCGLAARNLFIIR